MNEKLTENFHISDSVKTYFRIKLHSLYDHSHITGEATKTYNTS